MLDQLRPTMGIIDPLPIEGYGPLKVSLLRTRQFDRIMRDSLLLCEFVPWDDSQMVDITVAVTGWDTSLVELYRASERILTMFRLINIREGYELVPLPEGASYLGFMFARAATPAEAEAALRAAHEKLKIVVAPKLVLEDGRGGER